MNRSSICMIHQITAILTLAAIGLFFSSCAHQKPNVPVAETPAPPPAIEPTPEPAATPAEASYTIQPGDTLGTISKKFYGNAARWKEIAKANGIADANKIKAGQTLKIPADPQASPAASPRVTSSPSPVAVSSSSGTTTAPTPASAPVQKDASPQNEPGTKNDKTSIDENMEKSEPEKRSVKIGKVKSKSESAFSSPTPKEYTNYLAKVYGPTYRDDLDSGKTVVRLIPSKHIKLVEWKGVLAGTKEIMQGRYAEALAICREEIRLNESNPAQQSHVASMYNNCAQCEISLGMNKEALADAQKAIAIRKQKGTIDYSSSHLKLAMIHMNLGDNATALKDLEDAESIASQFKSEGGLMMVFCQRALIYFFMGRVRDALAELQKAEDLRDECSGLTEKEYIWMLNATNLSMYFELGQFEKGIPYLQSIIKTATGMMSHLGQAVGFDALHSYGFAGIGFYLRMLGQNELALKMTGDGLEIAADEAMLVQQGMALEGLGYIYMDLGKYDLAFDSYRLAKQIFDHLKRPQQQIEILTGLAKASYSLGQYSKALEYCKEAEKIIQSVQYYFNREFLNLVKGQTLAKLGRSSEALQIIEAGLPNVSENANSAIRYQLHLEKARLLMQKNDLVGAKTAAMKSIESVEILRESLPGKDNRAGFMYDKMEIYDLALSLAERSQKPEEAFNIIERAKARAFLDLLGNREIKLADPSRQEKLADELKIKTDMIGVSGAARPDGENASMSTAMIRIAQTNKDKTSGSLMSELKNYHKQIEASDAELASLISASAVSLADLRNYLPQGTCILNFYVAPDAVFEAFVTNAKITLSKIAISKKDLEGRIFKLRNEISDPDRTELTALYKLLLSPFVDQLTTASNLIILPHQSLHYLPFEMLIQPDGKYFGQKLITSYAPSASILYFNLKKEHKAKGDMIALGNPIMPTSDFSSLENTESEVKSISSLMPNSVVLTGKSASEKAFKEQAAHTSIIHFATHGYLNRRDPMESAIVLSKEDGEDGFLTAYEIFGLNLPAGLATISACETGLGGAMLGSDDDIDNLSEVKNLPPGDEMTGLTRAFHFAGVPSVVASLWEVETYSTEKLMVEFYKNLAQGKGRAEALFIARNSLIKDPEYGANPYYWAPFVLIGDWR